MTGERAFGSLFRPIIWVLVAGLVLLPDGDFYWRQGGMIFFIGPLIWVLVFIDLLVSRKRPQPSKKGRLPWLLLAAGFLLCLLFWLRVRIGQPAEPLGRIILTFGAVLAAATPAQLLALVHRDSVRRLHLHLAAFVVGVAGCFGGLMLADQPGRSSVIEDRREPGSLTFLLFKPTADPRLLSRLPVVDALQAKPEGLLFHRQPGGSWSPRQVNVSGRTFGWVRRNLSHPSYGIEFRSLAPEKVSAELDVEGGWRVAPHSIGPAAVEIRKGRAVTYLGVWSLERTRQYPEPIELTRQFGIADAARVKSDAAGHASQRRLQLTWLNDAPVVGPLFAVIELPPRVAIKPMEGLFRPASGAPAIVRLPADGARSSEGRQIPVYQPDETILLDYSLTADTDSDLPIRVFQTFSPTTLRAYTGAETRQ